MNNGTLDMYNNQPAFHARPETKISSPSRFEAYRKYSRTANNTLTTLANEMSEILKVSMEHIDCLNLMVRGVCNSSMNNEYDKQIEQSKQSNNGLLKYRQVLNKVNSLDIPNMPNVEPERKISQISVELLNKQLSQELRNIKQSGDGGDKQEIITKKPSVLLELKRNKIGDSAISLRYTQEKSVMDNINKEHKKFSESAKSSDRDESDMRSATESTESKRKNKKGKLHKRKKKENRKPLNVSDGNLKAPVVDITFAMTESRENVKLAKKIKNKQTKISQNFLDSDPFSDSKEDVKITRLSRKYANENFQNNFPKNLPIIDEEKYGGRRISISSDNKQDWSVIMHTQKLTKQNSTDTRTTPRLGNILEKVTLKDLEPLKAEYPRKDNIIDPESHLEHSFLYKLVNENPKSLEMLVDVTKLDNGKKCFKKPTKVAFSEQSRATLLETTTSKLRSSTKDVLSRPKLIENTICLRKLKAKVASMKEVKSLRLEKTISLKKMKSKPASMKEVKKKKMKDKETREKKCKQSISLNDYQVYRKLSKHDAKRKLRKFMIDPNKSYNQQVIVLPVFVDYDKEYLPDISEVNSKETIVPEEVLKPYIYTDICGQFVQQPTIMTVTVPNVNSLNKKLLEPNKPLVKSNNEVLVQRMMSCKQGSNSSSTKPSLKSRHTDGSQLVSFIIDKEKQNTVDTLYSIKKKSQQSGQGSTASSQKKTVKTSMITKSSDLKRAIDNIEGKLKDIIGQPQKRDVNAIHDMELEVKSMLSKMQIDLDTPDDFSFPTSRTNSSVFTSDKSRPLLRSKTNLETNKQKILTAKAPTSKKLKAQPIKSSQLCSTSTSATTTTHQESVSKLIKTIESQKPSPKVRRETKASMTERRPIRERTKIRKEPEPKKPPELQVIMAPERDYNNLRKNKMENVGSAYTPIKFTTPHTNLSVPSKIENVQQTELTVIFPKNEKKPSCIKQRSKRNNLKEIKREPVDLRNENDLHENIPSQSIPYSTQAKSFNDSTQKCFNENIPNQSAQTSTQESNNSGKAKSFNDSVSTKISSRKTNENTMALKLQKFINENLDESETGKSESAKQDGNLSSDTLTTKSLDKQVLTKLKGESKKKSKDPNVKQSVNSKILSKWQILENPSNHLIPGKLQREHSIVSNQKNLSQNNLESGKVEIKEEEKKVEEKKVEEKKEEEKKVEEKKVEEKKEEEKKEEIKEEEIKEEEKKEEEKKEEEKKEEKIEQGVLEEKHTEANSVHAGGKVVFTEPVKQPDRVRPFTADVSGTFLKEKDVALESKLSVLQKHAEEESKALCNEVNDAIQKIQEQNVITQPQTNMNIQNQTLHSERFWTPFMDAVKEFRKNENHENLYDFMKEKGHIRSSTEIIRHQASIKCYASEVYVNKRVTPITYGWTDSDLNVEKQYESDFDSSVEDSSKTNNPTRCLKRMSYHQRLSELMRRKLELMKSDFNQEVIKNLMVNHVGTVTEKDFEVRRVQFDEKNLCTLYDQSGDKPGLKFNVDSIHSVQYKKFLACFYGFMFMTIFCGLNMKYSCT